MNIKITELIEQEIQSFKGSIWISENNSFDHYDTIEKINNYRNDKFHKNTEADVIFWNDAKVALPYFNKKLRLKQKNFKMYSKGENNFYQGWIANMRWQSWARESGFTLDLEDLKETVAIYGTVIMKLVSKESAKTIDDEEIDKYNLEPCYFTNLYYDTSVENIIDSVIIERHEMTEMQLRSKSQNWRESGKDTIKQAIKNADVVKGTSADNVITKFIIYERTGEYKKDLDNDNEKPKYMQFYVCGSGDKEVILFKRELKKKDCPYIDFHLTAYQGRHLRVGIYERLFPIFQRRNRLVNENAEASKIASLLLLKSQENDMKDINILQQAKSGMVLDTQDLEQIEINNRYFQYFISEMTLLDRQRDLLCMTPEVSTGNLPADATVRGQILSANEVTTAFEPTVDRIGFRMVRVLMDKIMPAIVAEWNKEDIIEISESEYDVRVYDFYAMKYLLNKWIGQQSALGKNPTPEEQQAFIQNETMKMNIEGRRVKKMKGFFNFKYGFYMNPTGAIENKERKNEAYQVAMGMVQSNPAIVNMPLFRQFLEDNNIEPFRFTQEEIQNFQQTQQRTAPTGQKQPDKLLGAVKE